MSVKQFDLTGKIALLESSVVEVYPSENKAVLSVPNRGTIQTNTTIAYCWLKQYDVLSPTSIDSSDDAVILIFRLDAAPFAKMPKDEMDSWLDQFRHELVHWAHEGFSTQLKDNIQLFKGDGA